MSLLEALKVDMEEVKDLVQNVEQEEKPSKTVNLDSFKRLQDKVKSHGDLLTRWKNREGIVTVMVRSLSLLAIQITQ